MIRGVLHLRPCLRFLPARFLSATSVGVPVHGEKRILSSPLLSLVE
jgi:hypothetical protein